MQAFLPLLNLAGCTGDTKAVTGSNVQKQGELVAQDGEESAFFFPPMPNPPPDFPGARNGKNSKLVAAADGGTVEIVRPVPQRWQTACRRVRLDVWGASGDSQPADEREVLPVL